MLAAYSQQLMVFLLVLTRISGLIMTAPVFGPRSAPLPIRALLAVALAAIVTPLQPATFSAPDNLFQLGIVLAREAVLGLSLGLALIIFFSGMHLAGNLLGQMSGLQLADAFDPTFETNVPVFGQLLDLIAMAAFVALDGHRKVTAALLDTFRWRPPGSEDFPQTLAETLTSIATESFLVGIRAGAPVMVSLLLAIIILGLISRTLPQLNVFVIGFNLNAAVVLASLALSLGTIQSVVEQRADSILEAARDAISGIETG